MADIKVYPSRLNGEVKIPPSKSMAHRAVICAALGDGLSKISNIDYSDDIIATINGMRALGAVIEEKNECLEVRGINSKELSVNRLRFLVPISLAFEGVTRFVGRGNLGKRPLKTYYDIFDSQGIEYSYLNGVLDLVISGKLRAGTYEVEGNISSQFITGLLFTLPLLDGDSKISITTELESKGYLDLTLSAMKDFGIKVINNEYKEFIIKGNQRYRSRDYRVEGDYSQGAFFLSADALGNEVTILDLKEDSLQGDREVVDILERMGVVIEKTNLGMDGQVKHLNSTLIDASQCPDIIPVLSAVAALSNGKTEIINAGRLRIKECDRLAAVTQELNKLGAKVTEKSEGLIIEGVGELEGGVEVWSHKDHRIAMTLAIASTRCKAPIIIKDYECVSKSYPHFFEDFKKLGGRLDEWHMGK